MNFTNYKHSTFLLYFWQVQPKLFMYPRCTIFRLNVVYMIDFSTVKHFFKLFVLLSEKTRFKGQVFCSDLKAYIFCLYKSSLLKCCITNFNKC